MTTLHRKPIFGLALALFSPIHIGRPVLRKGPHKSQPPQDPPPSGSAQDKRPDRR